MKNKLILKFLLCLGLFVTLDNCTQESLVIALTLEQAVNQCNSLVRSGRQLTPQEVSYCQEVYRTQECIIQQQQRINEAQKRINNARIERYYCSTDACVDAWNIKESEAQQDLEDAYRDANSQSWFR